MPGPWEAEITTDPDREDELYIELLEGAKYRGRIYRDSSGELILLMYEDQPEIQIPSVWLAKIMEGAERDLPRKGGSGGASDS